MRDLNPQTSDWLVSALAIKRKSLPRHSQPTHTVTRQRLRFTFHKFRDSHAHNLLCKTLMRPVVNAMKKKFLGGG